MYHPDLLVLGPGPRHARRTVQLPDTNRLGQRISLLDRVGTAPMDKSVQLLIEDAKLVAIYGQRSGSLSGSTLAVALHNVAVLENPGWGNTETTKLQNALSTALDEIRPVTLIDLRSGWDPFTPGKSSRRDAITKWFLLSLALVLIVFCGSLTIWQKKGQQLLAEMEQGFQERESALIRDVAFRLAVTENLGTQDDLLRHDSLSREALRERIEELRVVSSQLRLQQLVYRDLLVASYPGRQQWDRLVRWWNDLQLSEEQKAARLTLQPFGAADQPAIVGSDFNQRLEACVHIYESKTLAAATSPELVGDPQQSVRLLGRSIAEDTALMEHIDCLLGLSQDRGTSLVVAYLRLQTERRQLRDQLELRGNWILPALYGMLGATLYYLRRLLNPMLPSPRLLRVPLRVALGGLAGISVAWFWSPATTQNLGVPELSLGLLTIAFLLGYAIDLFFALLDRLVTIGRSWVNRLGAAN